MSEWVSGVVHDAPSWPPPFSRGQLYMWPMSFINFVHNFPQAPGPHPPSPRWVMMSWAGPSRGRGRKIRSPYSLSSACGAPWIGESALGSTTKGEKGGESVMGHPHLLPHFSSDLGWQIAPGQDGHAIGCLSFHLAAPIIIHPTIYMIPR